MTVLMPKVAARTSLAPVRGFELQAMVAEWATAVKQRPRAHALKKTEQGDTDFIFFIFYKLDSNVMSKLIDIS